MKLSRRTMLGAGLGASVLAAGLGGWAFLHPSQRHFEAVIRRAAPGAIIPPETFRAFFAAVWPDFVARWGAARRARAAASRLIYAARGQPRDNPMERDLVTAFLLGVHYFEDDAAARPLRWIGPTETCPRLFQRV
jgi:hypothetical protein